MHRKARVYCGIGLALASITLACGRSAGRQGQPTGQTQEDTLTVGPPPTNGVDLIVVCPPPQGNASLQVVVNPPYQEVDSAVAVTWTRTKRGPGAHDSTFTIDVATVAERSDWPWYQQDDQGIDIPLPWSDDTSIVGLPKDEQQTDAKKYIIRVGCNDDRTTIDPRMKVRPE